MSAYHHYVLLCEDREGTIAALGERGIATGVHYPVPLHRQPGLAGRVRCAGPLAAAERLADSVLSIPVHPELSDAHRSLVVEALSQETVSR